MVIVLAVGKSVNGKPIITKVQGVTEEACNMNIYKSRDRPNVYVSKQLNSYKGGAT